MALQPYIEPRKRLPYAVRMRNRCIAAVLLITLFSCIGSCIFAKDEIETPLENTAQASFETPEEEIQNTVATVTAAIAPKEVVQNDAMDSTHILKQKNLFMAKQIDKYLRRFKPKHALYLIVEAHSNEIIAWGEMKDELVQAKPDYLARNTFPAASIAKTVTLAAALESNQYNLESPIPAQGKSTHLYRSQLRVKEPYVGPTLTLREVYAHSANPSMAIVGHKLGAKKLKETAHNLGYNMVHYGFNNDPLNYAPPDTGYALYEVASGFTDSVRLSPLVAAAQVRSIITKKPLEIPWGENMDGFAPDKPYASGLDHFKDQTYREIKDAMIATATIGSARKRITRKNMARKSLENLTIGGKTGTLDGKSPQGRYEWFAGFAEAKKDPRKSIVVVVMQVYGQMRTQSSADVAAILINHWANEYIN
ncbi:MAG: penicillin-binding protein [Fibrobacter sp.]|nr:penicillin-binding protein [Fibrobacter sp.]